MQYDHHLWMAYALLFSSRLRDRETRSEISVYTCNVRVSLTELKNLPIRIVQYVVFLVVSNPEYIPKQFRLTLCIYMYIGTIHDKACI